MDIDFQCDPSEWHWKNNRSLKASVLALEAFFVQTQSDLYDCTEHTNSEPIQLEMPSTILHLQFCWICPSISTALLAVMAQIWELPWPNSLQQLNLEYEMHFEVNLLQLLRALLDIRHHLKKNNSVEDLCECWLLKKPVWDCSEKERKVGPTCNVRENANEKKCSSCIEGWVPSPTCIGDGHQDRIREHLLKWKAIHQLSNTMDIQV